MTDVSDSKLLKLARAGKVDEMVRLFDLNKDGSDEDYGDDDDADYDDGDFAAVQEADEHLYKWLQVAADFGHKKKADKATIDLLETSSLHHDDYQLVVGLTHL